MVKDKEILKEMETECLAALEEYDRRYHAGYVETLQSYLKHNGSIQAVAAELYTHRNTVLYRIGNIRKILGNELKTAGRETALSDCILYQKYAWADISIAQ